jgi:hypothetical protein
MFGDDKSLYTELPVDIDTFIEDDHYIGKSTRNGQSIYPFWRQRLREMFDPEHPNKYREMFCATAIGTGKTRITIIAFTYTLYCYMCLRNPDEFFKFTSKDTLAFVIASVGKTQFSIPQNTFLDFVMHSPWFKSHGSFTYKKDIHDGTRDIPDSYIPFSNIEIIYASKCDDVLGVQVMCAYTGHECERYNGNDTYELYSHIKARIESRSIVDHVCYGRMFTDFELTNDETNIKTVKRKQFIDDVLHVGGSQFMVKPQDTFDYKDSFYIAYDGIYGHSKIITKDDFSCCQELVDGGWKFICCPINTLEYAKLEPDRFLLQMCGIQLSVPKKRMSLAKAFEELMNGKAIIEDGKNEFYALDENGFITAYNVKTNKKINRTKFIFDNNIDIRFLLNSNNWISFPNPVNNDDSET